ncbi:MAG: Fic family protein [Bacteroides stercoris]|uniref:Fic family protein n=1 Tax=Bacteroides stercoris TaxID=46506 RepID=UPI00356B0F05
MVVNAPEGLVAEPVRPVNRTSAEQLAVQVTEQVRSLLLALSNKQLSLKGLMEKVGLKQRPTFLENYITPAFEAGVIKVLYPDKPNHPRQKYLLTAKGLALYNEIKSKP